MILTACAVTGGFGLLLMLIGSALRRAAEACPLAEPSSSLGRSDITAGGHGCQLTADCDADALPDMGWHWSFHQPARWWQAEILRVELSCPGCHVARVQVYGTLNDMARVSDTLGALQCPHCQHVLGDGCPTAIARLAEDRMLQNRQAAERN